MSHIFFSFDDFFVPTNPDISVSGIRQQKYPGWPKNQQRPKKTKKKLGTGLYRKIGSIPPSLSRYRSNYCRCIFFSFFFFFILFFLPNKKCVGVQLQRSAVANWPNWFFLLFLLLKIVVGNAGAAARPGQDWKTMSKLFPRLYFFRNFFYQITAENNVTHLFEICAEKMGNSDLFLVKMRNLDFFLKIREILQEIL